MDEEETRERSYEEIRQSVYLDPVQVPQEQLPQTLQEAVIDQGTVRARDNMFAYRIPDEISFADQWSAFSDGTTPDSSESHYVARQMSREEREQQEQQRRLREARAGSPASRGAYRLVQPLPPIQPNHDTQCVHCRRTYAYRDGREHINLEGSSICSDCRAADYLKCAHCETYIHRNDGFVTHTGRMVCEDCFDTYYSSCDRCSRLVEHDNVVIEEGCTYCPNCHQEMENEDEFDEHSDDIFREVYNRDKKFCSNTPGKLIKSSRIFSAEIECYYPNERALIDFAKDTPQQMGIGTDGSLNTRGVEIRTPILKGKAGEDFIKDIGEKLVKGKFKVDKCCGMHIHLDKGNLIPRNPLNDNPLGIKLMMLFYLVYEDVILSFLPRERRNNNFCRSMRANFHMSEIYNACSLDELEKVWYRSSNRSTIASLKRDHHHDSRYHGFNVHCLLSQGHFEVRFHSGTINSTKILEWVNLHQRIMDMAEGLGFSYAVLKANNNITDMEEKTKEFFKNICLPKASVDYFMARQAKFAKGNDVEDNLETL